MKAIFTSLGLVASVLSSTASAFDCKRFGGDLQNDDVALQLVKEQLA
jgi:hypothetical protein